MGREVEKMIMTGIIWGTTNALMRRGALSSDSSSNNNNTLLPRFLAPLLTWQYAVPFLVNLSASAAFFSLLGDSPISIAVPVTNATTFAATAAAGLALGEEMRVGTAAFGTALILVGVSICIA